MKQILAAAALTLLAVPLHAAGETSSCVPAGSNARVAWAAPAGEAVRTARAYFRSDAASAEHYVELRRNGERFTGLLPKAANTAGAIEYRVATAGADGRFTSRTAGRISVGGTCRAESLEPSEANTATALIIGSTSEGPAVPAGFRCDGIVGRVTKDGVLKAYSACNEIAASAKAPAVATANATTDSSAAQPASAAKTAAVRAPRVISDDAGVTAIGDPPARNSPSPIMPPNPRGPIPTHKN